MALVAKRSGAPAGTITVSTSFGVYAISDTPLDVTDLNAYYALIQHPYLQASGAAPSAGAMPAYTLPVGAYVDNKEGWADVVPVRGQDGIFRLRPWRAKPAPRTTGMWVDFFRLANDGTPVFSNYSLTASRFRYIVMNVWERTHMANLRAQSRNIRGLAYQEYIYDNDMRDVNDVLGYQGDCASAISRQEITDWASGGGWWATASPGPYAVNPNNASGRLVRVNLPEVQAAMNSNMLARVRRGDVWDGVFADDVNYNVPDMTAPYTTDAAWYLGALRPALQQTGAIFGGQGLQFVGNWGSAGEYDYAVSGALGHLSGYLDEFWMRYNGGGWNGYWFNSLRLAEKAVASGTTAFLSTPGSSNTSYVAQHSGLAAALMVVGADPASVAWHFKGVDHTNEKWSAAFEQNIGAPTGPWAWTGTTYTSGLIRYFQRGVAVLNPAYNPGAPWSNAAAHSGGLAVTFTGGTYSGYVGTSNTPVTAQSGVTLQPGEGAVMTKDT